MTEILDENIGYDEGMTYDETHDITTNIDDTVHNFMGISPHNENLSDVDTTNEFVSMSNHTGDPISNNHGVELSFQGRTQDGINKLYDPEILKANEKLLEGAKELQNAHTEREFKDATAKMEEARNSVKFWEQAKLDMERIETPLLSWESVEDRYNKMGG